MPKRATIAPDNILYRARMKAVAHTPELSSRDGAAYLSMIPIKRLLLMETGRTIPHFHEIDILTKLYKAPGLPQSFCMHSCPYRLKVRQPSETRELMALSQLLCNCQGAFSGLCDWLVDTYQNSLQKSA